MIKIRKLVLIIFLSIIFISLFGIKVYADGPDSFVFWASYRIYPYNIPLGQNYYCINHKAEVMWGPRSLTDQFWGDYPHSETDAEVIARCNYIKKGNYNLTYQQAYILSSSLSPVVEQAALWETINKDNAIENDTELTDDQKAQATQLLQEGANFQTFHGQDHNISITSEDAKAEISGTNYRIGPFTIDYNKCQFGTISKATIRDENDNDIYTLDTSVIDKKMGLYIDVPQDVIKSQQIKLHVEYTYTDITNLQAQLYELAYNPDPTTSWQYFIYPNAIRTSATTQADSKLVTMGINLSGYVFEDEGTLNSIKDANENYIKGIKVIACSLEQGEIASTITDDNGYYEFKNLPAMQKFYIKYVYNGQNYQPTRYSLYNNIGNRAVEKRDTRSKFNAKFQEIIPVMQVDGLTINNLATTMDPADIGNPAIYAMEADTDSYDDPIYTISTSIDDRYVLNAQNGSPNNETSVVTGLYSGAGHQEFYIRKQEDGYYKIVMAHSGKCLDVKNGSTETKTPVWQYEDNGTDSQKWSLKDLGNGYYNIIPKINTDLCLDVDGGQNTWDDNDHEHNLQIYTSNGTAAQKFKIQKKYFTKDTKDINFGLAKRETVDISVNKDVDNVKISMRGGTQKYTYRNRENFVSEIADRIATGYYSTNYTRDVEASDYNYTEEDGLDAIVTYKITVINQSQYITCAVPEILDLYDEDYTYINAYIEGKQDGVTVVQGNSYRDRTYQINGYNTLYLTQINDMIEPGKSLSIYVDFKVNKDADGKIKLDSDLGKSNITEVFSYKTFYSSNVQAPNDEYQPGGIAGRIDSDSNPGNVTSDDTSTFEDDTDSAPHLKFEINENERNVNGTVWEDNRTEKAKDDSNTTTKAKVGNGIKDSDEALVDGVTVELWDKDKNTIAKVWKDTAFVDARTQTSSGGKYQIGGFVPGNYYVKFIYPDGQDYKSTTYNYAQVNPSFNPEDPDQVGTLVDSGDVNYSDARDVWTEREKVNGLLPLETNGKLKEYNDKTKTDISMQAITGAFRVNIEENGDDDNPEAGREYSIPNIDFGLQKRAKAQLMTEKEISNIKVVLSDGSTLFDASGRATNVLWQNKIAHEYGYETSLLNKNINLMKQPIVRQNNQKILLTMDQEILYAATMKITYKITVRNIGEVDYISKWFYYTGRPTTGDTIATTTVHDIIDYPGAANTDDANTKNNLQYDGSLNDANWTEIRDRADLDGLVDESLTTKDENGKSILGQYKTILKYTFNKELMPEIQDEDNSSVSTNLVLTQMLAADNKADDLQYGNVAEIISVSNKLGRKMYYSTVGNQNPNKPIAEVDSDSSQTATILPPFGQPVVYYTLALLIDVIIFFGVVLIQKKIMKKKFKK